MRRHTWGLVRTGLHHHLTLSMSIVCKHVVEGVDVLEYLKTPLPSVDDLRCSCDGSSQLRSSWRHRFLEDLEIFMLFYFMYMEALFCVFHTGLQSGHILGNFQFVVIYCHLKRKLSVDQTPRLCNLPSKIHSKINVSFTSDDDLIKELRKSV